MLAELDHPKEADIIAESIAFDFTESSSCATRLSQFTPRELEVIASFLDECSRRYDSAFDCFSRAAEAVRSHFRTCG